MESKAEPKEDEIPNHNWSEGVEDLVAAGETEAAISLLETEVSKLEKLNPSETVDLQLASALSELAKLYSSIGFSLKSDDLLARASLIKLRCSQSRDDDNVKRDLSDGAVSKSNAASSGSGNPEKFPLELDNTSSSNGASDDDWEAVADREPEKLFSSQCLPSISNVSLEDTKGQTPKRRGRGTFSYKKHELYSEWNSDSTLGDDVEEDLNESKQESGHSKYGTRHVLVVADFPPSTRTIDLERLVEDFHNRGVSIRWVNDTVALAVFRSPSIALEAYNSIQCPFTLRFLSEDDILSSSIKPKDLEPPRQRPQTSARTAQRLIAQGMGLKLPSSFGSRELKTQEEARKNRIDTRHKLRHDAWGDD